MPTNETLRLFDVLRVGVLLLAFVATLIALTARERKLPYIANSIFYIAYGILFLLITIVTVSLLQTTGLQVPGQLTTIITSLALVALVTIYLQIFFLHNRVKNMRHDQAFKNITLARWLKALYRRLRPQQTYEHQSAKIKDDLLTSLQQSDFAPTDALELASKKDRGGSNSLSGIYHLKTHSLSDTVLCDLSLRFIRHGCWVQYTTCARHPIEFLAALKGECKQANEDWAETAQKVVVVDAYTPHFGFTDSIHSVRADQAKKDCLDFFTSKPSFAGIHTAGAEAFNAIKRGSENLRKPTLVIYEGLHALVDLESREQYRIFYNHVLPSERLWGSMFTVVVEFQIDDEDLQHISVFGDYSYPEPKPAPKDSKPKSKPIKKSQNSP